MPSKDDLKKDLSLLLSEAQDLETELDALRNFKKKHVALIQEDDLHRRAPLPEVFTRLSDVADVALGGALRLAEKDLVKTYGYPTYSDNDGNLMRAEFAVVGMGKLGGREIHYGSDLDLIFLYSRNGQTEGRKIISNREFYARQA